nr:topoisomerase C-terminal repeat-containing protein [Arcobacter vandammei]
MDEALFLFTLPRVVGVTLNNEEIKANIGRFGPYLQVKTKYYSLKTDDPYTVDEQRAREIISEIDEAKSKALIKDFEKEKIQILNGAYGAYIKQGRKNYKIPKGKIAEELSLEECLEIIEKDSKTTKKPARKTATTKKETTAKKTTKAKKE